MSRLVDYFVVVGYNHSTDRGGVSNGIILQRFPESDWEDTPFINGIELFCQPQGWKLLTKREDPSFIASVLTDIQGNRHYCANLCFYETLTRFKPVDEDEDIAQEGGGGPSTPHRTIMYAPKCLVLLSQSDYIETFRNCLEVLYSVCMKGRNSEVKLETLVGKMLGWVYLPAPGGQTVRFSLGAGDKQVLLPPLSTIPTTSTNVATLFKLLVMTEQKIVFRSKSYTRITQSCRALIALMYPFKYSHTYVPLLPAAVADFLASPTPFVMGVHSSVPIDLSDNNDVIVAELDIGHIKVPDTLDIPSLPEPFLHDFLTSLGMILQPELETLDCAFLQTPPPALPPKHMDKRIRAVFLRFFAQFMQGYRYYLTVVRIHPKPVITFHKAGFLGERGLVDCEFTTRVLDSMFFTEFIMERGPPYRHCDRWDQLYAKMPDVIKKEQNDPELINKHIKEVAKYLYLNEHSDLEPRIQMTLKPGAKFPKNYLPSFPEINADAVQVIINEGLAKKDIITRNQIFKPVSIKVPMEVQIFNEADHQQIDSNSARRLEVLKNCILYIFENKISDARKSLPAVLRALKNRDDRICLCDELKNYLLENDEMLDHLQFDLIVQLMNGALKYVSPIDEFGIAAALLPLSTSFCRKLSTGVVQFAYTCIQDHAVWENKQFWVDVFYEDVQKDITALYAQVSTNQDEGWNEEGPEVTALEVAVEQIRLGPTFDTDKLAALEKFEESIVYSKVTEHAGRLIYLIVPLHFGNKQTKEIKTCDRLLRTKRSRVVDATEAKERAGTILQAPDIVKIVKKFVDSICVEGGVNQEHIENLYTMIPSVVQMQIENLQIVHKELKKLTATQKAETKDPILLGGEEMLCDGLRAYLLPDGREETCQQNLRVSPLLPAEGVMFLTNYRVIFKGASCDPLACDQIVVKSFPVTSLTKEKKISIPQHLDDWVQQGLQLRSNTFQLIKIAFDEEVSHESIEQFRKTLNSVRCPTQIFQLFAFSGKIAVPQVETKTVLKGFTRQMVQETARKVGFKRILSPKCQKYVLHDRNIDDKYSTIPGRVSLRFIHHDEIEEPVAYGCEESFNVAVNRSYVRDWERLNLITPPGSGITINSNEQFKISTVNIKYGLCKTYPALLVMPSNINDDNIRKFSRFYKHRRVPAITWQHPKTKALLLRGASNSHYGKCAMSRTKINHPHQTDGAANSGENDFYLSALVACTPTLTPSINSLLLPDERDHAHTLKTVPLYVLSDKTHKGFKVNGVNAEFIPVEYPDVRTTKASFKKLMRACVPSSDKTDADQSFHRLIESSGWLHQLQSLLQLSGVVVDLLDTHSSSVMICLEDGWDVTCLISSLAQLCLDPYYRTIVGFRVLVEKEWLAFGHRFGDKSPPVYAFTPTFLQFLDLVHQVQKQFPLEFEFNEFYLRLLAYHSVSCRFRTFLLDCESERVEFGITALEDKMSASEQKSISTEDVLYPNYLRIGSFGQNLGESVFDYIGKHNDRAPIFFNFLYNPNIDKPVLRPQSNLALLDVWSYYISEDLRHGPSYDLELLIYELEELQQKKTDAPEGTHNSTRYDCTQQIIPDSFTYLFAEINKLERTLGHLPQNWQAHWKKSELPTTGSNMRNTSSTDLDRSYGDLLHNRSTLEILERGKMTANQPADAETCSHPHLFKKHNFIIPAFCDFCSSLQWIGLRCMNCGYNCHEKCCESVPKACTYKLGYDHFKKPSLTRKARTYKLGYDHYEKQSLSRSVADTISLHSRASILAANQHYYDQFSSNVAENKTHEGYLCKKGALLKGWKQRWFVLDCIKHQLRYYDAMENPRCKGFIELAEVTSVAQVAPPQKPPKNTNNNSFFDLRTQRRTYNFCASDFNIAQEWIEKLQACLQ